MDATEKGRKEQGERLLAQLDAWAQGAELPSSPERDDPALNSTQRSRLWRLLDTSSTNTLDHSILR